MKKISVIIPTYSPSDYIQECLNSIAHQTLEYVAFEVIIILNGPRDPYWKYLDNLLKTYTFCSRLLYSEISGVSNARNIGLKYARGEYIAFVDDDDCISDYYLQGLYEGSSPDVIVVCNVHSFGGPSGSTFFLDNWMSNVDLCETSDFYRYRSVLSVPWAKLIPYSAIGDHTFDIRFANGEDALFVTSVTNKIRILRFADKRAMYSVRIRQGSASRKKIKIFVLCKDTFLLCKEYIFLYLSDHRSYSFILFVCRIPGVLKNFLVLLKNSL